MLATDFSISAMFLMFLRIPLSSFLEGSGSTWRGGGGARKDTGRRDDTEGRDGKTKGEAGLKPEPEGDEGDGRGGGGGGGGSGGDGGGGKV